MKSSIKSFIFFLLVSCSICGIDLNKWELFEKDVSFFAMRGTIMWKITTTPDSNGGGNEVHYWDNSIQNWVKDQGSLGCVALALSNSELFCRNKFKTIGKRGSEQANPAWSDALFQSNDIKIHAAGNIYYITNTAQNGAFQIRSYDSQTDISMLKPGDGIKVAPISSGLYYFLSDTGVIQKLSSSGFVTLPESATDIFAGSDDKPVIVSKEVVPEGFKIKKWNTEEETWQEFEGIGGVSLAFDSWDLPYIVTNAGEVYRMRGVISNVCPSK